MRLVGSMGRYGLFLSVGWFCDVRGCSVVFFSVRNEVGIGSFGEAKWDWCYRTQLARGCVVFCVW